MKQNTEIWRGSRQFRHLTDVPTHKWASFGNLIQETSGWHANNTLKYVFWKSFHYKILKHSTTCFNTKSSCIYPVKIAKERFGKCGLNLQHTFPLLFQAMNKLCESYDVKHLRNFWSVEMTQFAGVTIPTAIIFLNYITDGEQLDPCLYETNRWQQTTSERT